MFKIREVNDNKNGNKLFLFVTGKSKKKFCTIENVVLKINYFWNA